MTACVPFDMSMFADYAYSKLKGKVVEGGGWWFAEARTDAKGADEICSKLMLMFL